MNFSKKLVLWISISFALPFIVAVADSSMKVGYGGELMDENAFKKMSDAGMNYYIWKMSASPITGGKLKWENGKLIVVPNQKMIAKIKKAATIADKYGMQLFLTTGFNKHTLNALKSLGEYDRAEVDGPRSYLSRGVNNAPWPGDDKLWSGLFLQDAVFAAQMAMKTPGIAGYLLDLEMYAGKINWWYCASFDVKSFEYFQKQHPDLHIPELKIGQRYNWLKKNKLLGKYYDCLSVLPYEKACGISNAVKNANPQFQLGMLPFGLDWFHPWFAKGLAENMNSPVLIFSETEYKLGFSPSLFATMRYLDKMNFKYRYIPGLHIVKHSPDALKKQIQHFMTSCDSYWLYTMASLVVPQAKLPKSYRFSPELTEDDYWRALKEGDIKKTAMSKASSLITPDIFKRQADITTKSAKCEYNPAPDEILGKAISDNALFDGLNNLPGFVAWNLGVPPFKKRYAATITFSEKMIIDKIALSVPTARITNFLIVGNFDIAISVLRKNDSWHTVGKWKSTDLKNNFLNIVHVFKKPEITQKIVITLIVTESDEKIANAKKKYDEVFVMLSEVCVWGRKSTLAK